jgi:mono/diheme cytochrome c family protein
MSLFSRLDRRPRASGLFRAGAFFTLCSAGAFAAAAPAIPASPAPQATDEFARVTLPFLKTHCYECHANGKAKGGISLEGRWDAAAATKDHELFAKVIDLVKAKEMPPDDEPAPAPAEADAAMQALDRVLLAGDARSAPRPVRRLNRAEYTNTVRDLLSLKEFRAAENFPKDENGYGFDNNADLLTLSPLLMEQYLAAAEQATTAVNQDREARRKLMEDGFIKEDFYNKLKYARSVLEAIAPRAWRRPVSSAEIDRLYRFVALSFAQNGESAKAGISLAIQALLVSPEFLFRVELDGGDDAETGAAGMPADYKLANRLAYFLWSSMPDDELFRLAGENKLHEPEVLKGQVRRLFANPKARALTENFAGQWLTLRNLDQAKPDPQKFPTFTESLRSAMREETERFFSAVVTEDRSIFDFIDADFTYLNAELAAHYGIPGIEGSEFRRVTLDPKQRGGVLTHASILTVTSYADRTSPVQRGVWILENILNAPPPPAPPTVPPIEQTAKLHPGASTRFILEQHRADPSCAACHQRMDPLGIAFENYDPIGRWRTRDGDFEVDAAGALPGGKKFNGAGELRQILRARPAEFRRCLVEKLLTYALGRGLGYRDRTAVAQICAAVEKDGDRFSSLIFSIVQSELFQPAKSPAPTS